MYDIKHVIILFCFLFASYSFPQPTQSKITLFTGADRLLSEYIHLIEGKRVGIVTNQTGILSNGTLLVDTLCSIKKIKITALFGPEHGIRGNVPAGEIIADKKTSIPIFSLYGRNKKPTKEMLKNVNVLIFDIQDVGVRFYTYISTMFYILQAATENNIPVIILDRPNPINGISVDGPVITKDLFSFVGIAPIPIMYGLTIGELARLFTGEGFIGKDLKPNLTVIPLKNWKRNLYADNYTTPWVPPSPNIPDISTAIAYPGVCLIEGTNVSEGRGTLHPFLTIGAPFIDSDKLISKLHSLDVKGIKLRTAVFTPKNIAGMALEPKYKGQICHGISIEIINRKFFEPVKFGIKLIYALNKLYPEDFKIYSSRFDRLSGDKKVREYILDNKPLKEIFKEWNEKLKTYRHTRNKYLLY